MLGTLSCAGPVKSSEKFKCWPKIRKNSEQTNLLCTRWLQSSSAQSSPVQIFVVFGFGDVYGSQVKRVTGLVERLTPRARGRSADEGRLIYSFSTMLYICGE